MKTKSRLLRAAVCTLLAACTALAAVPSAGAGEYEGPKIKFKEISCGYNHAMAIAENGDLYTWGFNNYGQTGIVELNGDVPSADNIRIRRLSTVESWKLMGFTEEDLRKAEKVNSNTQLLKQAGNSIVVDVLVNVFKELF